MLRNAILALAALAATVTAQTETSCSPLNATCPADEALGTTYEKVFNSSTQTLSDNLWNITAGESLITYTDTGAEFTISKSGQSVTAQTQFYIFWGSVEVIMQASSGVGIISTFDLLSDDLDEIDVEIMGGNSTAIETNWYGWGNTSQYNSKYLAVDGPAKSMHNYTVVWDDTQIEWLVDGSSLRTVPYAVAGQYPQTPSFLKIGIWAGGDSSEPNGTIEWAGGETVWGDGPFTMTIQSIKVTDGSQNASSYSYNDHSGAYSSIDVTAGQSAAYKLINKSTKNAAQKAEASWNKLSTTAKIAIAASVGGVLVIAIIAFTVFCVTQRKRGRAERAIADQQWELQQSELMEYRQKMARGEFSVSHVQSRGEKF